MATDGSPEKQVQTQLQVTVQYSPNSSKTEQPRTTAFASSRDQDLGEIIREEPNNI